MSALHNLGISWLLCIKKYAITEREWKRGNGSSYIVVVKETEIRTSLLGSISTSSMHDL